MGQSPDGMYLVETVADARQLQVSSPTRLAYVTQTTLSVDDAALVVAALKERFPEIIGPKKDDICYATQNRQDSVKQLARTTEVVLVVGSRSSSNSNRLREVAELIGSLPVGTGFAQVTFDITPDYYYVGYARMRVAHTDANVGACDPSDFGSAVDFTLSVDSEGWPCLPLQGYGTQLGDGFTDIFVANDSQAGFFSDFNNLYATGKGKQGRDTGPIPQRMGALRHHVPQWLRLLPVQPAVLQIAESQRKQGGAGAYYVYLRRR